jgi:type IV secretion system protein VirB10
MTASASERPAPEPPVIAIRERPPSPRRLSRKVLLAGALSLAAVVVVALAAGLSERQRRAGETETQASAAGPPESIQQASENYESLNLRGGEAFAAEPALEPPTTSEWTSAAAAPLPAASTNAPPDPEAVARGAPILFSMETEARGDDAAARTASSGRHGAFMADQRGGDERLDARLVAPRSAYELIAGSIIPAALQTELNSDLPGRVIAQVTAPVYDSVTGAHLLVPQGSRLIGSYDSATTYGDRRLLLVWNRLILPNGWSINLQGMDGADVSGAAGVRDRVDNHLGRLTGAIALSAVVSDIANEAESDDEESFGRSVGDAAAQEAARSGGRIIDRELSVRPTLRVRVGAPVRLLVTRDIRLRPYRP